MTNKRTKDDSDIFARKTYKEVKIWDWLARILPLSVLAILSVCYFFKWNSAIDLILEVSIIVFVIVCFIWWYWAIYKIATTVKYLRNSQERFKELKAELSRFKKDIMNIGRQDR